MEAAPDLNKPLISGFSKLCLPLHRRSAALCCMWPRVELNSDWCENNKQTGHVSEVHSDSEGCKEQDGGEEEHVMTPTNSYFHYWLINWLFSWLNLQSVKWQEKNLITAQTLKRRLQNVCFDKNIQPNIIYIVRFFVRYKILININIKMSFFRWTANNPKMFYSKHRKAASLTFKKQISGNWDNYH